MNKSYTSERQKSKTKQKQQKKNSVQKQKQQSTKKKPQGWTLISIPKASKVILDVVSKLVLPDSRKDTKLSDFQGLKSATNLTWFSEEMIKNIKQNQQLKRTIQIVFLPVQYINNLVFQNISKLKQLRTALQLRINICLWVNLQCLSANYFLAALKIMDFQNVSTSDVSAYMIQTLQIIKNYIHKNSASFALFTTSFDRISAYVSSLLANQGNLVHIKISVYNLDHERMVLLCIQLCKTFIGANNTYEQMVYIYEIIARYFQYRMKQFYSRIQLFNNGKKELSTYIDQIFYFMAFNIMYSLCFYYQRVAQKDTTLQKIKLKWKKLKGYLEKYFQIQKYHITSFSPYFPVITAQFEPEHGTNRDSLLTYFNQHQNDKPKEKTWYLEYGYNVFDQLAQILDGTKNKMKLIDNIHNGMDIAIFFTQKMKDQILKWEQKQFFNHQNFLSYQIALNKADIVLDNLSSISPSKNMQKAKQIFQTLHLLKIGRIPPSQGLGLAVSCLNYSDQAIGRLCKSVFYQDSENIRYYLNFNKQQCKMGLIRLQPENQTLFSNSYIQQELLGVQAPRYFFFFNYQNMINNFLRKHQIKRQFAKYIQNIAEPLFQVVLQQVRDNYQDIKQSDVETMWLQLLKKRLVTLIPKQWIYNTDILEQYVRVLASGKFAPIQTSKYQDDDAFNIQIAFKKYLRQKLKLTTIDQSQRNKINSEIKAINQSMRERFKGVSDIERYIRNQKYQISQFISKKNKQLMDQKEQREKSNIQKELQLTKIRSQLQNKYRTLSITDRDKRIQNLVEENRKLKIHNQQLKGTPDQIKQEFQLLAQAIVNLPLQIKQKKFTFNFHDQWKDVFVNLLRNSIDLDDFERSMLKFFKLLPDSDQILSKARQQLEIYRRNTQRGVQNMLKGDIRQKIQSQDVEDLPKILVDYIYKICNNSKLTKLLREWKSKEILYRNQMTYVHNNIVYLNQKLKKTSDSDQKQQLTNLIAEYKLQQKKRQILGDYVQSRLNAFLKELQVFLSNIYKGIVVKKQLDLSKYQYQQNELKANIFKQILSFHTKDELKNKQAVQFTSQFARFQNNLYNQIKQINATIVQFDKQLLDLVQYKQLLQQLKSGTKPLDQLLLKSRNQYLYSKQYVQQHRSKFNQYKGTIECFLQQYIHQSAYVHSMMLSMQKVCQSVTEKIKGKQLIPESLVNAMLKTSINFKDYSKKLWQNIASTIGGCGLKNMIFGRKQKFIEFYKAVMSENRVPNEIVTKQLLNFQRTITDQNKKSFDEVVKKFQQFKNIK